MKNRLELANRNFMNRINLLHFYIFRFMNNL
nr:MAG TPA: hypothetical protein [Caudoviricetes sp.]